MVVGHSHQPSKMKQPKLLIIGVLALSTLFGCKEKTQEQIPAESSEIQPKMARLEYEIQAQLGEGLPCIGHSGEREW